MPHPEVLCTPGRSRTDTGDPFRGPASSFGLRGLHEDTPNGSDKRRGGGLLSVRSGVNFAYLIPLSGITDTLRYHFTTSITLRKRVSSAARALQAGLLPSAPEHSVQHVLSDAAGKGVLLARVIATDE